MALAMSTEPVEKQVHRTKVRLERGDLTAMSVDAVVYYARETLELSSGFGAAIQARGGDTIKKELATLGRIEVGQAVVTAAGNLHARHVIHTCGPRFQEPGVDTKLAASVQAALRAADERGLQSVAFPPMGAGFHGVPLDTSARVMGEVFRSYLQGETSLRQVTVCVIDKREFVAFQAVIQGL
jgi:O-acetyl-ADP-ribose deacetylase